MGNSKILLILICFILVNLGFAAEKKSKKEIKTQLEKTPINLFTDGSKNKKAVAFTFDDGPGPKTREILDILKKYNVRVTFFMLGDQVKRYPEIAQEVKKSGHEIGNHTYGHINFFRYKTITDKVKNLLYDEIIKTEELIQQTCDESTYILRLPHGYCKPWVQSLAKEQGYYLVNWTFGCDWQKISSEKMLQSYLKRIHPGTILLMHDGWPKPPIVNILPQLIEETQKRGLEIVPVGELLELNQ